MIDDTVRTKWWQRILCFMGLHQPKLDGGGLTASVYRTGTCIHCGKWEMWF